MDLKTALEQRDNYIKYIQVVQQKTSYAQDVLSKVPAIPRNEDDYKLKNTILKDLDYLNKAKVRAEAKATLINSGTITRVATEKSTKFNSLLKVSRNIGN